MADEKTETKEIKAEPLKPDKWIVKVVVGGKEVGVYKLTINKNGKPCLN